MIPKTMLGKTTTGVTDLGLKEFLENRNFIASELENRYGVYGDRYTKGKILITHYYKTMTLENDTNFLMITIRGQLPEYYKYKEKLLEDLLILEKQYEY